MSRNQPSSESSDQDTLAWAGLRDAHAPVDLTGTRLGDFAIERQLGRGGMGEVYLARQTSLNREVALKVIRPDLLSSPNAVARFEKEAWTAAKLNDPNVVHIYAIGSIGKVRYIAMEYVQGVNLKDYLGRKGPPELPLALSIMKQAGNAVRAAGEMGLIHRDIKPENILITKRGLVKVADFGLCRDQNDEASVTLTQQGVAMGTPLYMSPEQAQGFALDHRSDLYSLGVTFYHMLAGEPPFRADSPIALAVKHVKEEPRDLAALRADLPADLCRLVMKLMAKTPSQRYQSASEMLRDLARIKEQVQTSASLNISTALANTQAEAPGTTSPEAKSPIVVTNPLPIAPTKSASGEVESVPSRAGWLRILPYVATVLLFAAGLIVGWKGRPPDLLSIPEDSKHIPGLWMVEGWQRIPQLPTGQAQYRYALIEAPDADREAAWIAVPGYHPSARQWVSQAYTQLGRELFRKRDVGRLEIFVGELERTNNGHDGRLAASLKVGVGALKDDADTVLNTFGRKVDFVGSLSDPALAELCLEITNFSITDADREQATPSVLNSLTEVQRALIFRMMELTLRDTFGRTNVTQ